MNKRITIEINGTRTKNRGAELMTIAIIQRMQKEFPNVRVVVPNDFGTFEERGSYGLWTTWDFLGRRAKIATYAMKLSAPWIHNLLGVCAPGEVDVVLDANGFGFSDQWGPGQAKALLEQMNRPDRRHQKLIFLPQAFGPFENPEVARETKALFARSILVFARDSQSRTAVEHLSSSANLLQAPDFTIDVKASAVDLSSLPKQFVAIVPNARMLDKTEKGGDYIRFLDRAVEEIKQNGLAPIYILHDTGEDAEIIKKTKARIPVFQHKDPRVLKYALGQALFVVGSRYHALVSTLNQAVPCLGVGWSHKYPELFAQYKSNDCIIEDINNNDSLKEKIRDFSNESIRLQYSQRIEESCRETQAQVDLMWDKVLDAVKKI